MESISDSAFIWRPDEFVHLQLEADREGIGDDALDEVLAGDRCLASRNGFEGRGALMFLEGGNPGEEDRTDFREIEGEELFFGPLVIFDRSDDEFHFVAGFQVPYVFQTIAFDFAAGRAFQIHDATDTGIDGADVESAAGFNEDSEARVAQRFH